MARKHPGKSGQALFMDAGANGITVNFTPPEWEAHYGLYVRGNEKTYLVSLEKAQRVALQAGLEMGLAAPCAGGPLPACRQRQHLAVGATAARLCGAGCHRVAFPFKDLIGPLPIRPAPLGVSGYRISSAHAS